MNKVFFSLFLFISSIFAGGNVNAANTETIEEDIYKTSLGDLKVSLIGHGSLRFVIDGKVIYVDPYSKVADYSKLEKADLILLTHEHADHLDKEAIEQIRKAPTRFVVNKTCFDILGYGELLGNGDTTLFDNIEIEAVPAYNIISKRPDREFYHPRGRGNGYVLTFGNLKVYVAGNTENIAEMSRLRGTIDIAFLPKNFPYTMTDEMFVDAAKRISPRYLYPYHFSEFDEDKITKELDGRGIKILVRPMTNK
ncbi:MBL fold metallo-hydrolase [Dysgonomonas sp. 520]|uniref:MBL fold metallo-hydrolase n=1 Tax=Dysgonomonas sp. 520 TaxID=2302931 RepID=UPI0013D3CDE8|nr:MBL fold metallo-hydrolase [Dysgonomonas sp. 520]NDW09720.1 MBL fold metallo-hydrolase [Dysgonomonas sp. 520]